MLEFVLATHNKNKVREMERLLGQTLGNKVEFSVKTAEQVGVTDEIEENGSTFEENARIKARALASDPGCIRRVGRERAMRAITKSCSASSRVSAERSAERALLPPSAVFCRMAGS